MDENAIVKQLEKLFTTVDDSVLKFINYTEDRTEILVKGTKKEWKNILNISDEQLLTILSHTFFKVGGGVLIYHYPLKTKEEITVRGTVDEWRKFLSE